MKGKPVDQLVYDAMFPKPSPANPQNFHALLQRHLIFEVRQEVHSFYGHLETPEAKYPGLDYSHPTHRIRLSRWQWHRRLFRAFDALRLTPSEIANLTKWEGTKWAKERYEREQGITIHDTTADCFPDRIKVDYPTPPVRSHRQSSLHHNAAAVPDDSHARQRQQPHRSQPPPQQQRQQPQSQDDDEEDDDDSSSDEDEEVLESVGASLNERLRERVALRNVSGDHSVPLDEEWENWLKNAVESGQLPHVAQQIARAGRNAGSISPDDIFPPRMLAAARAGSWNEIPDLLHEMIRQGLSASPSPPPSSAAHPPPAPLPIHLINELQMQQQRRRGAVGSHHHHYSTSGTMTSTSALSSHRRTFADLRLPGGHDSTGTAPSQSGVRPRIQRTAQSGV